MRIPRKQEIYNPILDYLNETRKAHLSEIREAVASYFILPPSIAFNKEDNEPYSLFEARVNRSCWDLWHAGLITRLYKGIYGITDEGFSATEDYVDRDFLKRIPQYIKYEESVHRDGNSKKTENEHHSSRPPRKPPEFIEIEKPSIIELAELRRQDTFFANILITGEYIYEDGLLLRLPYEVQIGDITYQEFKASAVAQGTGKSDIKCYKDANGSGKMTSGEKIRNWDPGPRGPRGPRKWANPYPPDDRNGDDHGDDNFNMIQDMIRFNRNNHGDFNVCFKHLLKDIYHITYPRLAEISGVSQDQIRRMCNTPGTNVNIRDLAAIVLSLQASSHVFDELCSLVGQDPSSERWQPYSFICDTMKHSTYEKVNEQCRKAKREEIFISGLSGTIGSQQPYENE